MTDDIKIPKEEKFYDLRLIEVKALRKCLDAIEALQDAEQETGEDIAAGHMEEAVNQIKLAMKGMGI